MVVVLELELGLDCLGFVLEWGLRVVLGGVGGGERGWSLWAVAWAWVGVWPAPFDPAEAVTGSINLHPTTDLLCFMFDQSLLWKTTRVSFLCLRCMHEGQGNRGQSPFEVRSTQLVSQTSDHG